MSHKIRFNAIASDPTQRIIRVHAASLKFARMQRACPAYIKPACKPSDARQCRIIINALERKIDRLRRGVDRIDHCKGMAFPAAGANAQAGRGDEQVTPNALAMPHASPRMDRLLYAVRPIGQVCDSVQPDVAPPVVARITHYAHVTNHGSLIDVLV